MESLPISSFVEVNGGDTSIFGSVTVMPIHLATCILPVDVEEPVDTSEGSYSGIFKNFTATTIQDSSPNPSIINSIDNILRTYRLDENSAEVEPIKISPLVTSLKKWSKQILRINHVCSWRVYLWIIAFFIILVLHGQRMFAILEFGTTNDGIIMNKVLSNSQIRNIQINGEYELDISKSSSSFKNISIPRFQHFLARKVFKKNEYNENAKRPVDNNWWSYHRGNNSRHSVLGDSNCKKAMDNRCDNRVSTSEDTANQVVDHTIESAGNIKDETKTRYSIFGMYRTLRNSDTEAQPSNGNHEVAMVPQKRMMRNPFCRSSIKFYLSLFSTYALRINLAQIREQVSILYSRYLQNMWPFLHILNVAMGLELMYYMGLTRRLRGIIRSLTGITVMMKM